MASPSMNNLRVTFDLSSLTSASSGVFTVRVRLQGATTYEVNATSQLRVLQTPSIDAVGALPEEPLQDGDVSTWVLFSINNFITYLFHC